MALTLLRPRPLIGSKFCSLHFLKNYHTKALFIVAVCDFEQLKFLYTFSNSCFRPALHQFWWLRFRSNKFWCQIFSYVFVGCLFAVVFCSVTFSFVTFCLATTFIILFRSLNLKQLKASCFAIKIGIILQARSAFFSCLFSLCILFM